MIQIFQNRSGETVAFLADNLIIDAQTSVAIGIVLGNCVFGQSYAAVAKMFKEKIRDLDGNVIAVLKIADHLLPATIQPSKYKTKQWDFICNIKNHNCQWVEEKENWSSKTLREALQY